MGFGPRKYYLGLLLAFKIMAPVGLLKNHGPRAKFWVGLWPGPALIRTKFAIFGEIVT